ncbi:D-alanine--D-alanine ligase|uniref:D-alanine--D-alanine ligase family protein n=1 Tax=Pseudomonas sp. SbOxS1 TaxID=2723884 RepID=UPI0015D0D6FA|nr:D-alanine--D-alanine ligase [Pseudomonas sp. SbOxS1]NYU03034.1 D-alanine--D-alanine ligase [Pseudomonas sp. SbOxS1]
MKVAIVFGGAGSERMVSVASAQHMSTYLPEAELWHWLPDRRVQWVDRARLLTHPNPFINPLEPDEHRQPLAVDIDDALEQARQRHLTLVLALHGVDGEDGTLALLCEEAGVAFTGSGSRASRLAFNKLATKTAVQACGVPTLPHLVLSDDGARLDAWGRHWLSECAGVVAKPVSDGSSYGLFMIRSADQWERFLRQPPEVPYMIEPLLNGIEATVGVIEHDGLVALEPVEIRLPDATDFDYISKYLNQVEERCPSTLPSQIVKALKSYAIAAHQAVAAEGYSRSDFIVRDAEIIFLEINTLPGMTQASLLPKELAVANIDIRTFLLRQILLGQIRMARGRFAELATTP